MKDAPPVPETPTFGTTSIEGSPPKQGARQLELPLTSPGPRVGRAPASRSARRPRPNLPTGTRPSPNLHGSPTRASTLPAGSAYRRLDERTRRVGLEGIAAARALLERGGPIDTPDENGTRPGRAA